VVDALEARAVRVFLGFALGVVLAMDRGPLARDHRSGQPGPEAEEMRQHRMEIHAAVGLAAMQVQGHREDGELGGDQQVEQQGQPVGMEQAAIEPVEEGSEHRRLRGSHPRGANGTASRLGPHDAPALGAIPSLRAGMEAVRHAFNANP
jgi:hypothetical protein